MKLFGRFFAIFGLLAASMVLSGCNTGPKFQYDPLSGNNAPPSAVMNQQDASGTDIGSGTLLQQGNSITVSFSDTPTPILPIEDVVKDDGTITLIYNQKFQAAGKTVGELQNEIRERYVPQYFKFLTISIKTQDRFFSVGGEVRLPGRQLYSGRMTVLQAINTAGGFTDFSKRSNVQVIRANRQKLTVNCIKALEKPELDAEIFPGDQIYVHKRF